MATSKQFDPASGTRDFLAAEFEKRERAFATIRAEFARFGFQPLQTPAFERLDVLTGKYGDEGDKLIFKILRRGEHEASGEADLALRYDLTVPWPAHRRPTAANSRRRTSDTPSLRCGEPTAPARDGSGSSSTP
ncbi:ATP phosphoribosyltransferase regulatory subunit [Streptomyces sp. NPDC051217]|uniref:ATP phosphoribosyltransferase regulatory subunit n=1 Tax=Streptomyces sp. NPDC051217 TaxID=3365644 RepID=UPI0037892A2F